VVEDKYHIAPIKVSSHARIQGVWVMNANLFGLGIVSHHIVLIDVNELVPRRWTRNEISQLPAAKNCLLS
jgi:hypothetical protein